MKSRINEIIILVCLLIPCFSCCKMQRKIDATSVELGSVQTKYGLISFFYGCTQTSVGYEDTKLNKKEHRSPLIIFRKDVDKGVALIQSEDMDKLTWKVRSKGYKSIMIEEGAVYYYKNGITIKLANSWEKNIINDKNKLVEYLENILKERKGDALMVI